MPILFQRTAALTAAALLLLASGCTKAPATSVSSGEPPAASAPAGALDPESFLKAHDLRGEGAPERFTIEVPASWEITLGAYPVGLYWQIANQLSLDAGLDLTTLKGKTVEVWRYPISLPGEGDQARFQYTSDAILLVQQGQVVGGWLSFNRSVVGPSVKHRSLEQITGLPFDAWAEREQLFSNPGENGDLAALGPVETLTAYLDAINAGDKIRAHAIVDPAHHLTALTMNSFHLDGGRTGRLYNTGFMAGNSMVEPILSAKLRSSALIDPSHAATEISEIGSRTKVAIRAELELTLDSRWVGSTQPIQTWYATLVKRSNGWKLKGFGSHPPMGH